MKTKTTILVSLVQVRRPSGKVEFMRFKAAVPNNAARDMQTGEPKPSFNRPYLVDESSDFPADRLDTGIMKRFYDRLEGEGYQIKEV